MSETKFLELFCKGMYKITDYGACVCDSLQTEAIQKTIDVCFQNGGGTVLVPCGIFYTGGLRLRSGVRLHLESGAILIGSNNPEDYTGYVNDKIEPLNNIDEPMEGICPSVYPFSRWNNAIIRVIDAENIAITGDKGSYINGVNCYDNQGEEDFRGPHVLNIQNSKNVYLEGYTIVDSGNWSHAIFKTANITARNVTIYGGHDGFDVRTCDNVLIEDCAFSTGDDCVAGYDNNDVIVRNCKFDSACSVFRFGGNNVLIENCNASSPTNFGHRYTMTDEQKMSGVRTDETCRHNTLTPFLYYCDFRTNPRKPPENITIRNCNFESPDTFFRMHFDGEHRWCCNRPLLSIKYEDCTITNICETSTIHGDEKEPISFTMKNVNISVRNGFEDIPLIEATNFKEIIFDNVSVNGLASPTIIARTKGDVKLNNSTMIQIKEDFLPE